MTTTTAAPPTTGTHGTTTLAERIEATYRRRQDRTEHPDGTFAKAGRWYPSEREEQACCRAIRRPSRHWPYSLMLHCRTRRHVANLIANTISAKE